MIIRVGMKGTGKMRVNLAEKHKTWRVENIAESGNDPVIHPYLQRTLEHPCTLRNQDMTDHRVSFSYRSSPKQNALHPKASFHLQDPDGCLK